MGKIFEILDFFSCGKNKTKKNNDITLDNGKFTSISNIESNKPYQSAELSFGNLESETIYQNTNTMRNDIFVMLDRAHGQDVPGKKSLVLHDGRQLFEWKYSREICQRIKDKLDVLGIPNTFINDTDNEIGLSKRAEIANEYVSKYQNCILVSVHCNAAGNGFCWSNANGWEVWSTKSKNNSDKLAQCFLDSFKEIFPDRRLRGHKEENYTVLYKTNCPCVLTENFFMDNMEETQFMLSEEGKEKITELHVKAILKYFNI